MHDSRRSPRRRVRSLLLILRAEAVSARLQVADSVGGPTFDDRQPIKPAFAISSAQICNDVVGRHKVSAKASLNGSLGEGHAEMRLADSARTEKNHIAGIVNEAQRAEFANLSLVIRWLKPKVDLLNRLQ